MKLIILDRDGVINYDSPYYIKSPEEWIPIPGSLDAIAKLYKAGWTISVATNQSGIGRGLYSHEILAEIHAKMQTMVASVGGKIDSIFYCPHHPIDKCQCRKPQPGLLNQIAQHYRCDLTQVPFVGDKWTDVEAAQTVGCQSILVATGLSEVEIPPSAEIPLFANLAELTQWLLNNLNLT